MFNLNGKELTITKNELTEDQEKRFNTLIGLGDSENLALWTVQHMSKSNDSEMYSNAYYG